MSHHRNPHSLLTPTMRGVLARMARASGMPLHAMPVALARLAYQAGAGVLDVPPRKLARVEAVHLSARDGYGLAARLYAPLAAPVPAPVPASAQDHAPLPVMVFFHGGGFTIGNLETHDTLCRELSFLAHCAVVSVDYRLAPEHRFPVAVHDAWDALSQVAQLASGWGLDGGRLAVGGDSAGGTLAAVCAILARDAGLPLALQLLFYPGCAAHQDTPSHTRYSRGFVLDEDAISWFFDHYIDPHEREDWRFSPLNAPDLDGVAPAWLGLAECDPLVDEGVLYADKLRLAGVPVDLEIYRGMVHSFIQMGRVLPEAHQAHLHAARALKQAFGTAD